MSKTTSIDIGTFTSVGIGDPTPSRALDIRASVSEPDGLKDISLIGTNRGDAPMLSLKSYLHTSTADNRTFQLQVVDGNNTAVSRNMVLQPDGGNVGIGTTNPDRNLVINAGANSSPVRLIARSTDESCAIQIRNSENTATVTQLGGNINSYFNGGNVGIGATSPGAKLEIQGDLLVSNTTDNSVLSKIRILGSSSASGDGHIIFQNNVSTGSRNFYMGNDYTGSSEIPNGFSIKTSVFSTTSWDDATTRLHITDTGNVGIGTTSPSVKLEVYNNSTSNLYPMVHNDSAGNAGWRLKNNQGDWVMIANAALRFYDVGQSLERMRIDSAGNVGIGTTNPASKLHVIGGTNLAEGIILGARKDDGTSLTTLRFFHDDDDSVHIARGGDPALTISPNRTTTAHVIKTRYGIITDQGTGAFGSGNSAVATINQHGEGTVFHVVATRHTGTANTPQLETGYVAFAGSGAGVYHPVKDHAEISITFSAANSTITATNLGGNATIRISVLQVA